MLKYKLTYFDFSGSRGEECRLALFVAGVEFEDVRITQGAWAGLEASTPYGAVPVLETPGKPPLAQSNAILAYVGRRYGLHPSDAWEAARHEAILAAGEELRSALGPSGKLTDPAAKKQAREELANTYLQTGGRNLERQITGPFTQFGAQSARRNRRGCDPRRLVARRHRRHCASPRACGEGALRGLVTPKRSNRPWSQRKASGVPA